MIYCLNLIYSVKSTTQLGRKEIVYSYPSAICHQEDPKLYPITHLLSLLQTINSENSFSTAYEGIPENLKNWHLHGTYF